MQWKKKGNYIYVFENNNYYTNKHATVVLKLRRKSGSGFIYNT